MAALILTFLVIFSSATNPLVFLPASVSAQPVTSCLTIACVAVSPTAIADLSKVSGSVTFELNVTNSAPFNLFSVSVQYGRGVLSFHPGGLDYKDTVIGTDNILVEECVDGASLIHGNCGAIDNPGVVTLSLAINGARSTSNPTNGELFNVTFDVTTGTTGVSQIHILQALLANNGNQIQTQTSDGYFSNKNCNGSLCKPPFAFFTVTPAVLRLGVPATFNASLSKSLNPGGTIRSYNWTWGANGLEGSEKTVPVVVQTYPNSGNYTVILTVTDNYSISSYFSEPVNITNKIIDTGIASLDVEPTINILPGTDVDITVRAHNFGTQIWNITLSLSVEGKLVNQTSYPNVARFHDAPTLVYIWHTTGKTPSAYRIDAAVDPQPGDNNTNNDLASTYVQIIEPRQSSLVNLDLLPATSLGIILIVAGSASVSFIRRKLRPDTDAL